MPRRDLHTAVTKLLPGNFGGWKGAQPTAPPAVIRPGITPPEIVAWLSSDSTWNISGLNSARLGDTIYVMDRRVPGTGSFQNRIKRFDAATRTFVNQSNVPAALDADLAGGLWDLAVTHLDADGTYLYLQVYVAHTNALSRRSRLWRYYPPTDTWTHLTDPGTPGRHANGRSACVAGGLYIIGGRAANNASRVANVDRYDIGGGTWAAKTALPVAAETLSTICAPVAETGAAIIWPGEYDGAYQPTVRRYDVVGDSWSTLADLPGSVAFNVWPIPPVLDDELLAYADFSTAYPSTRIWLWDSGSDTYTAALADLPAQAFAGFALGGKVYLPDGFPGFGSDFTVPPARLWYNLADF